MCRASSIHSIDVLLCLFALMVKPFGGPHFSGVVMSTDHFRGNMQSRMGLSFFEGTLFGVVSGEKR